MSTKQYSGCCSWPFSRWRNGNETHRLNHVPIDEVERIVLWPEKAGKKLHSVSIKSDINKFSIWMTRTKCEKKQTTLIAIQLNPWIDIESIGEKRMGNYTPKFLLTIQRARKRREKNSSALFHFEIEGVRFSTFSHYSGNKWWTKKKATTTEKKRIQLM